jgi:hypothetical protein
MNVIENDMRNSIQQSTEELLQILRDGDTEGSQFQRAESDTQADAEDNTVEIKIDVDSYVEDSSTIRGCHKICRLCAHLVYEHKLISIFLPDKTKCLASKINRLLPEKVSNMVVYSKYIALAHMVLGSHITQFFFLIIVHPTGNGLLLTPFYVQLESLKVKLHSHLQDLEGRVAMTAE